MKNGKINLKKKHVVIINGYPGSGKDTFVSCCNLFVNCGVHSSVNIVVQALGTLGILETKEDKHTPEGRLAIAKTKRFLIDEFDLPAKTTKERIQEWYDYMEDPQVLFCMIREPSEIAKIVTYCNRARIDCRTLLILNDQAKAAIMEKTLEDCSKVPESDIEIAVGINYDYTISNNGPIWDLVGRAYFFLRNIENDDNGEEDA